MESNSYVVAFESVLEGKGYVSVHVQPDEINIFYKIEHDVLYVVLNIDYHQEFRLESRQLKHMKEIVFDLFQDPKRIPELEKGYKDSHKEMEMLSIFWTKQQDGMKEIINSDQDCWYVDMQQNRLVIFENQKGEFLDLRQTIEDILFEYKKQSIDFSGVQSHKYKKPEVVNASIIILNIVVFLVLEAIGDTNKGEFMRIHGAMYPLDVLENHQWYRLLTSTFMHFGLSHLANNMVILYFLGDNLEHAIGKIKYILIYIISGISGGVMSLWYMVKIKEYAVGAGASGAIFGVIGALIYVVLIHKGSVKDLSARRLILMAGMSLYYGFTSIGVDNMAHLGGLIAGFFLAMFFYRDVHRKD
ncbi:rhomboid family intramembrane serine protease [Lachnospiraceae bacterium ZAX-1]